jgi:hypothetical protein
MKSIEVAREWCLIIGTVKQGIKSDFAATELGSKRIDTTAPK